MIYLFEVEGFKGFEKIVTLDLSHRKNYEFNVDCIKSGVVNKSVIYGANGIGKSNLGVAIFDIVSHLTSKHVSRPMFNNYINARNKSGVARFKYGFRFENNDVVYEYGKRGFNEIVYETLTFNDNVVASIDRVLESKAYFCLPGTETLNTNIAEPQISIINYIKNNAVISDSIEKDLFYQFIKFVDGMLYFRSLDTNCYIGLEIGNSHIGTDIIKNGNLNDFQEFLSEAGINYKLCITKTQGNDGMMDDIGVDFGDGSILPFFSIASTGTRSLSLFYYWMQRIKDGDSVSFVFIDEFDAFYHHALSMLIVKEMKLVSAQTVITTHNTSVMTNEILRPDCYFIITENGISSLSDMTDKELRSAHNIEKMYKAGTFKTRAMLGHD